MMYLLHYNFLPFTFTSLTILQKTYLNYTFVSTLSLIILSGFDCQENFFYLQAELTFTNKSTRLRDII